ncbi:MAG: TetR/AcrR family transcriptional regulator [Acidimicrobiia bacterium]|nr:TetR/AcrR family transcriptional regulator [Acidimicrobiia bacterium]
MSRAEQRDATRQRIVDAAITAFADQGFAASSTRDIAARAGVTQGLVTYHFDSKDTLWRAAATQIFGLLVGTLPDRPRRASNAERRAAAREQIRAYVRFAAEHPEVFHFMVDAGRHDDDRMRWLVQTCLAPRFSEITADGGIGSVAADRAAAPHAYYALLGAGSLIFAVAPECRELTGVDPTRRAAIERHADLMAQLFVPD